METSNLHAVLSGLSVMLVIVKRARQQGDSLVIPAWVVGQVWRDGRRQARLTALLASPTCRVDALDDAAVRRAGQLLGVSGTSDVIDASVVLSARFHRVGVVTSDPQDLRRLDTGLDLTIVYPEATGTRAVASLQCSELPARAGRSLK